MGDYMKIGTTIIIDSAHRLPKHKGKCANLHGHTYTIKIELWGDPDPTTGMLMDFGKIKEVVAKFDHEVLNDLPEFKSIGVGPVPNYPTAEHISQVIVSQIIELTLTLKDSDIKKIKVRVYEGVKNWAESTAKLIDTGGWVRD
jgi:6-pyruvoyltetrahydropterin/6-carboxytetrahydropterin synthase